MHRVLIYIGALFVFVAAAALVRYDVGPRVLENIRILRTPDDGTVYSVQWHARRNARRDLIVLTTATGVVLLLMAGCIRDKER